MPRVVEALRDAIVKPRSDLNQTIVRSLSAIPRLAGPSLFGGAASGPRCSCPRRNSSPFAIPRRRLNGAVRFCPCSPRGAHEEPKRAPLLSPSLPARGKAGSHWIRFCHARLNRAGGDSAASSRHGRIIRMPWLRILPCWPAGRLPNAYLFMKRRGAAPQRSRRATNVHGRRAATQAHSSAHAISRVSKTLAEAPVNARQTFGSLSRSPARPWTEKKRASDRLDPSRPRGAE